MEKSLEIYKWEQFHGWRLLFFLWVQEKGYVVPPLTTQIMPQAGVFTEVEDSDTKGVNGDQTWNGGKIKYL